MYTVYKITRTYSVRSGGCQSASGEKNKIKIKSSTIWQRHSYTLHKDSGPDITLYYIHNYVYTILIYYRVSSYTKRDRPGYSATV